MKKKIFAVVMATVLVLGLTACGAGTGSNVSVTDGGPGIGIDPHEGEITETSENTGTSISEEVTEETPKVDSMELYKSFIEGNEVAYFDNTNIKGSYLPETESYAELFEKGVGYSIADIVSITISDNANSYQCDKLEEAGFAYFDCGNDGEPELGVRVATMSEYGDGTENEYLFKNIDGKLQACVKTEGYYRAYEHFINKYGLIQSGVNISAYSYGDSYSYINAEGKEVYLYSVNTDYTMGAAYAANGGIYAIADKYSDEIPDDWCVCRYEFDDPNTFDFENNDYSEYLKTNYYTADPIDEELVKKIFNEAEVKLYTQEEMDEMALNNALSKGATKEIYETYETIQWEKIDTPALNEIFTYGANPVYVSNAKEFVEAIKDNANIVMEPGTYNLSEYIEANKDSMEQVDYEDQGVECKKAAYGEKNGELGLIVACVKHLKISSKDPENRAVIVSDPMSAPIIEFLSCDSVEINDVNFTHTSGALESGTNNIEMLNCYFMTMNNCDIYNAADAPIYLSKVSVANFNNVKFYNANYACAYIYSSDIVNFYGCEFFDINGYLMFSEAMASVAFTDTKFSNLGEEFIYMDSASSATFTRCIKDGNSVTEEDCGECEGRLYIY